MEDIAKNSPLQVAIAWTGPKVISTEIPDEHLKETSLLLKRPPFIWENYFANDGPRNCKFLKLKPYAGRSNQCLSLSEGHGFNLMNQPELSKILFLASKFSLIDALESEVAFKKAITKLCPKALEEIILNNRETFLNEGLDKINDTDKISLLEKLKLINHPISSEIINWLNGEYNVGSECLTD